MILLARLLLGAALHASGYAKSPAPAAAKAPAALLVFYKTAGYQHASIPAGVQALQELGQAHGVRVEATADAAWFTPDRLAQYQAVVFLSTSQDVLDDAQQMAFEQYIRAGHGFVGVHAATTTEYDWPWYRGLVGAYFNGHPAVQPATVRVVRRRHPASQGLPDPWLRTDEWYNFRNFAPGLRVLLTVDEASYSGGTHGAHHPVAWYHRYDGGRAFYTALGHSAASYADPQFRQHLWGGVAYALGR